MVPKKIFFTKGKGIHKNKLFSFELALRDAGIEGCNLVPVSSVFPEKCKILSKEDGQKLLKKGAITFCVMARNQTDKDEWISGAVGLCFAKNIKHHGYLFENHAIGHNVEKCGEEAQNLAEEMLVTRLGNSFQNNIKPDMSKTNICQSAKGESGLWTTVLSVAVFLE